MSAASSVEFALSPSNEPQPQAPPLPSIQEQPSTPFVTQNAALITQVFEDVGKLSREEKIWKPSRGEEIGQIVANHFFSIIKIGTATMFFTAIAEFGVIAFCDICGIGLPPLETVIRAELIALWVAPCAAMGLYSLGEGARALKALCKKLSS